ncbi:MAG: glycosyltransferase [Bryobacterales bacterium]|nr:glycosyltransferase [Bryobacterales bacterium]
MKILWVKSDFLHPTTRGGQIRTLETLKRLHQRHQIHYVALQQPGDQEGLARSSEYSTRAYPIPHRVPEKTSLAFLPQLVEGLYSSYPVAVNRYRSPAMKRRIEALLLAEQFDSIVCDFLFPAPNIPDLSACILFQHNLEALIWQRHAENASSRLRKAYFQLQAKRMSAYEGAVCRQVKRIIAVSDSDAALMRARYGAARVSSIPTGVDLDYFRKPHRPTPAADFTFIGSMDWMPNIDGMLWFTSEILPFLRKRRPDCSLAIVGRKPAPEILALARRDPRILVTGTVPDVRPYLWGSAASIVPLRIGGGTRLKIYEAMAAGIPVVSTTIGAEGLDCEHGANILIADQPADFAARCLELLEDPGLHRRLAAAALHLVTTRYSWDAVSRTFEQLLAP